RNLSAEALVLARARRLHALHVTQRHDRAAGRVAGAGRAHDRDGADAGVTLARRVGRAARLRHADVAALVVDRAFRAARRRLADRPVAARRGLADDRLEDDVAVAVEDLHVDRAARDALHRGRRAAGGDELVEEDLRH